MAQVLFLSHIATGGLRVLTQEEIPRMASSAFDATRRTA